MSVYRIALQPNFQFWGPGPSSFGSNNG